MKTQKAYFQKIFLNKINKDITLDLGVLFLTDADFIEKYLLLS